MDIVHRYPKQYAEPAEVLITKNGEKCKIFTVVYLVFRANAVGLCPLPRAKIENGTAMWAAKYNKILALVNIIAPYKTTYIYSLHVC